MKKIAQSTKTFILENKVAALVALVAFLSIVIVFLLILMISPRRYPMNGFPMDPMWWEFMQWRWRQENMRWWAMMGNWPMMWWEEQGKRLFERFCQSWAMLSGVEFVEKFKRWAEERLPRFDFIQRNLENVIAKAKKDGHDTTKLEWYLSWLNQLIADFESGSNNFADVPQNFCENHKNWMDMNDKIKDIMKDTFEEMENFK